jgi:predicted RNase H-like nuclease (RuvC/YqgF family)
MDDTSYRTWWALHLRAARGERLHAEEQQAYEAGLTQLHQSESFAGDAASLRQARAKVQTLEAEYARLHAQREQLEAEIAALESALDAGTRAQLALKD